MGDRRDLTEARRDLAAWLTKWSGKYSKLTGWVEDNIDETLTFYRLPRQHHKVGTKGWSFPIEQRDAALVT